MPNVTRTMAEWAAATRFEDLPPEVVAEAKRFLMDSVGCALGGAQQHDVHLARKVLGEIAGSGTATVLVTGERWDPVSASLLNALMIRVMDYNDIYWKQDPSHPSDIIPAAMAAPSAPAAPAATCCSASHSPTSSSSVCARFRSPASASSAGTTPR